MPDVFILLHLTLARDAGKFVWRAASFWTQRTMVGDDNWKMYALKQIKIYMGHDEIIKWKHFPHYWAFVRGIHWSPVNSPHKGQWHGALMFSLIWAWTNSWVNICRAGDLRCHWAHYDVTVMNTRAWYQGLCCLSGTPSLWPIASGQVPDKPVLALVSCLRIMQRS